MRLTAPRRLDDGRFQLTLLSLSGLDHVIQTSTNFQQWTSISTNLMSGTSMTITLPNTPPAPRRYYRAFRFQ